jgi:hypothetical protein
VSAFEETPAGRPVRPMYSDEEIALCGRYMDEHGDDPAEWPLDVRLAYAVSVATVRAFAARQLGLDWLESGGAL